MKKIALVVFIFILSSCNNSRISDVLDSVYEIEIRDYWVDKENPVVYKISKEEATDLLRYIETLKFETEDAWCEALVEERYDIVIYSKSGKKIAHFLEQCPGLVFYDENEEPLVSKTNRESSPYDKKYKKVIDVILGKE